MALTFPRWICAKERRQKVNDLVPVNYAMVALYLSSSVSPHIGAGEPTLAGASFRGHGKCNLHDFLPSGKIVPDKRSIVEAKSINFEDLELRIDFHAVLLHYDLIIVDQGDPAKVLYPCHDEERPSYSADHGRRRVPR